MWAMKILKILRFLFNLLVIAWLVWAMVSWFDVVKHNCYPGGLLDMWKYNFFIIMSKIGG